MLSVDDSMDTVSCFPELLIKNKSPSVFIVHPSTFIATPSSLAFELLIKVMLVIFIILSTENFIKMDDLELLMNIICTLLSTFRVEKLRDTRMYSVFNKTNTRIFSYIKCELARNMAPTLLMIDNIPDIDELLNIVFTSLTLLQLTFKACFICTRV